MNSNITIQSIVDLPEAASFIADCNGDPCQHVGYCGSNPEEILYTLQHHFSDLPIRQSLIAAYDNKELVGLLGLDIDKEFMEAEIWGPFIKGNDWNSIANELWMHLMEELPIQINRFNGFYNTENHHAGTFMQQHNFIKGNIHLLLSANQSQEKPINDIHLLDLPPEEYNQFITLHDELFPHSYYDGKGIVKRLNNVRKVIVAVEKGLIQGYVYFEANPIFGEGCIEFIGVSPNHRKKGIGRTLIKAALYQLFTKFRISEIQLCVSEKNSRAINLYTSAGFVEKYKLISYRSNE
ncbi:MULTISPECIES: GNAT family N-acetyltransferase [Heyndrickxia]|uniref:GNAT family N-acetyltransferase n=1 Tax=Heyndrickxia TaxID=2837504 RepID=UPI000D3B9355|nr:GNAT family N-acetyltransferase [Heyndrickxia sporothermodurans]PTY77116.1 hypothetical protein B5V89_15770 [Heyndrickxia sporothermodurans]